MTDVPQSTLHVEIIDASNDIWDRVEVRITHSSFSTPFASFILPIKEARFVAEAILKGCDEVETDHKV